MRTPLLPVLPFLLASTLLACGNADDEIFTVPSQPVEGRMGGMPWSMVDVYATPDAFDDTLIQIEFFTDDNYEPCESAASPEGSTLFFSVPAAPGSYELSLTFSESDMTATFYDGAGQNTIATKGVIEIESVEDDRVSGGLNVEADDDNVAAGEFSAVRCSM